MPVNGAGGDENGAALQALVVEREGAAVLVLEGSAVEVDAVAAGVGDFHPLAVQGAIRAAVTARES